MAMQLRRRVAFALTGILLAALALVNVAPVAADNTGISDSGISTGFTDVSSGAHSNSESGSTSIDSVINAMSVTTVNSPGFAGGLSITDDPGSAIASSN